MLRKIQAPIMKCQSPNFRQLRILNETEALDEEAVFLEENDDGGTNDSVESNPITGALRAGVSSRVENRESISDLVEKYEANDTFETSVVSATRFHVESGHMEATTTSPLEAKVVDESVVEAEVQARVQEQLR
jgi:predicted RecB family nuclease